MIAARARGFVGAHVQRPRLDEIQGGVLQSYNLGHARYLVGRVEDAAAGRAFLGDAAEVVTTAAPYMVKPRVARNVALSFAGLAALGVDPSLLAAYPEEFRDGMRRRALLGVLGDDGASHPDAWDPALEGHLLVTLQSDEPPLLDALASEWRARLQAPGLRLVAEQQAALLDLGREHFGFSDGFAQPSLRGVAYTGRPPRGNGVPLPLGLWRRLALGEIVTGYFDEDGLRPEGPPGVLGRDGTFMVWRKLAQDVARFRATLHAAAGGDAREAERLAAKVVGRWPDGTPLAVSPDGPDPRVAGDPEKSNSFRYGGDPHGERCPVGAHVRRANPRDGLGFGHKLTYRRRIVRRGMPYGPPLPPGVLTDDGAERGLVFVCFNASIGRQFEAVQGLWLAEGSALGTGRDGDPLLGEGTGSFTIPGARGAPPRFVGNLQSFVATRGGEYYQLPGLAALRALATGREADAA